MKYKVNGRISEEDGDWLQCPDCLDVGFIILKWFKYCPICGNKLDIEESEPE